jgi:hypothetical protein
MSTEPAALPDAYDAQPRMTEAERVADIFFAPSKTFADIRRNRSWWLPYLLLVVFGIGFSLTLVHKLGPSGMADSALRANAKKYEEFKQLPADQQATQRSIIGKVTTFSLYAYPVIQIVVLAFTALLLWGGFNFILGGSSTYPEMFAVAVFASLPSVFRAILGTITLFAGDNDTFNLQDPVGTNPGYYLSANAAPWLHSFLGSLDLLTLWPLFLMALGAAIVARVKPASGYALVFGVWLVFVLIKTGFAAAFS